LRFTRDIRLLLAIEAISLAGAALLHLPQPSGDPTRSPSIYEGTIALVLLIGLGVGLARPSWAAWAALATQAFGLVGASIGLYLAVRGVAPDSAADLVFHVAIVALLVWGLVVAWQARSSAAGRSSASLPGRVNEARR
jgi:hypothetical protein